VKLPGGPDLFRALTPLVLLATAALVLFEESLPGTAWLRAQLGQQVVLRLCVVVLLFYVLLLWGEAQRLHGSLTSVLAAWKQFHEGGGGKAAGAARNPKTRLEAARLLIAAMRSDDAAVKATSRHNLTRLVGKDLGDDPAAWQAWLQQQDDATGT
jgi:hypothetical protein